MPTSISKNKSGIFFFSFALEFSSSFLIKKIYFISLPQIDKKELKNLLKYIENVYENLDDDSLLVVALNGRTDTKLNLAEVEANFMERYANGDNTKDPVDFNDLFKGRCFLKYKNVQMEALETEIKDLYNIVNPGGKLNTLHASKEEDIDDE